MKLLVGLGNPGKQYEATRHNVGFMVADLLAESLNIDLSRSGWKSVYGKGRAGDQDVMIVKPQTYMNLSGEAVGEICRYFNLTHEDVIVIYDDMDLPVGKIRVRAKGSAGGHRGMQSVIDHLGTEAITRVKVGIGRPEAQDPVDYVMSMFPEDEWKTMKEAIDGAARAAVSLLFHPIDQVMNEFNGQS